MKLKTALGKTGAASTRIHEGVLARRPVAFSLRPGPLPFGEQGEDGTWKFPDEEGVFLVDVRPLTSAEECAALAAARAYAKGQGIEDPKEGETVYERAVMVHVVAAACVDHDSPKDAPEPFCTVEEAWELDPERIALLYEAQTRWQSETSPRRGKLTDDEFLRAIFALAGGDNGPFDRLPLATQRECTRSMARLWLASQTPSKPSTSPSSPEPESSKTSTSGEAGPSADGEASP